MLLFLDTETSGLSRATRRSVQIAWIVTDRSGRVLIEHNHIIRPDGFTIEEGAARVHGISESRAFAFGKPATQVLGLFGKAVEQCDAIVGHNLQFDVGTLENDIAACRMKLKLDQIPRLCTMASSTTWCRIPKYNGRSGFKWPTLNELHRRCFDKEFEDAHDALADADATRRCYFRLVELGVLELPQSRVVPRSPAPTAKEATKTPKHKPEPAIDLPHPGASISKSGRPHYWSESIVSFTNRKSRAPDADPPHPGAAMSSKRPSHWTTSIRTDKDIERAKASDIHPNDIPKTFTFTHGVMAHCPRCRHLVSVTLNRYEKTTRCPKCFGIVPADVDWKNS